MARGDNGVALSERMAAWCLGRTTEAAMEALGAARIPAGPVLAPSQVMAPPQVQASGFVEQVRYPGTAAPAPIVGAPLTLSDCPRDPMVRAPQAGEHSASILAGIGFAADEIAALVVAGAVQAGG
jgi:crotonobetainyl-CoA:carnitine CoA-transferase CaiB-like acyl-CoA transferase